MAYDQSEALRRFEGLLGLWKRFHEKVKEDIDTMSHWTALDDEGRMLSNAYNEELTMYLTKLGHENTYWPTLNLILEMQQHIICSGGHLIMAKQRLDNIMAGKAAFTEMLGTPAPKAKVWN